MSLSITKNKSKNSRASVRFTSTAKPRTIPVVPTYVPSPVSQPALSYVPVQQNTFQRGIQNRLSEATFRQYLDGFVGILPKDLPATLGNRLRYVIDTVDSSGRVISSKYRLGGWVKSVAPDLSYVVLFNPYAKKSWSLKIDQPSNKRLRLYFARRGTSDETAAIRSLVTKLQNGQLVIARR